MSDGHYTEANTDYTAGGRRMASITETRCDSCHVAGFSNVFDCALPRDHGGDHESVGGSSWSDLEKQGSSS